MDCDFQAKLDYTREPNKFKIICNTGYNLYKFSIKTFAKILLNFPNVKSCIIKITPTKTVLLKYSVIYTEY